jgi:hypothetical protein
MDELVEITFDRAPFDPDREPDARLIAPASGVYTVRLGTDGKAELVPVPGVASASFEVERWGSGLP